MTYAQAVNIGVQVLPERKKYTKRDVDAVVLASLFNKSLFNGTATDKQARFVVKCYALEINAEYSKYVQEVPVVEYKEAGKRILGEDTTTVKEFQEGLTRETSAQPALKFFKFWFHGREQGAIGISYDQGFSTMAAGEAEAREELASKYEVYHLKLVTRAFRVTFEDGDTTETEMNATLEEAEAYFLHNVMGPARNKRLSPAVKVEQV